MGKARTRGKVTQNDDYEFIVSTRGCEFLFDNDVKLFVEEVFKKSGYLNSLNEELEGLTESEDRKRNVSNQRVTKDWFETQINDLGVRFKKFLKL